MKHPKFADTWPYGIEITTDKGWRLVDYSKPTNESDIIMESDSYEKLAKYRLNLLVPPLSKSSSKKKLRLFV